MTTVSQPPTINATQIVDTFGRPYSNVEITEHNKRVAEGAPYSRLMTPAEMLKTYRLLKNPTRVFCLATGQTLSLSTLHSCYAASNVRIDDRKRVPVSQLWLKEAACLGVFFHSVNKGGEIEWQGQILSEPVPGRFECQLYDGIMGYESEGDNLLVPKVEMQNNGWKFYASAEEMRAAYEVCEAKAGRGLVMA